MDKKRIVVGHAAAWFCIFVWGTTFISSKILLRVISPVELLLYRFLIGYLVLFLMYPRRMTLKKRSHEWLFFLAGLSGVTIYYLFENIALEHTLATNVSIIVAAAPFFTALFVQLVYREKRLDQRFFAGFFVSMAGVVLVTLNGRFVFQLNPQGDILALFAAVCWGVYSTTMKKITMLGYPTVPVTRRIFLYGIVGMIPAAWHLGFRWNMAFLESPVYWGNLLFLGIAACAVCFVAWNFSVKVLGPMKPNMYIYAIPLVTIITAAVFLKESLTVYSVAGMLLTTAGLVISERRQESGRR